jgi:hypothetical protein
MNKYIIFGKSSVIVPVDVMSATASYYPKSHLTNQDIRKWQQIKVLLSSNHSGYQSY